MVRLRNAPAFILTLCCTLFLAAAPKYAPHLPVYPEVRPGVELHFPADHGAHPDFRTEWWYLTGWLKDDTGHQRGFQITFFRTRTNSDENNPSRFAPRQIIFAHAALSDPAIGHLLHDQRVARAGFGLAEAATGDTNIVLESWRLARSPDGVFHARIAAKDFALDLDFTPGEPILLEGENGYSRKGPNPADASYYYSLPHLAVSGAVTEGQRKLRVTGSGWLDREWSSAYLDPMAVGWDWVGLNLDDGGALMSFRMRDASGKTLWAGGTMRDAKGAITRLAPGDVGFTALRRWRSPRTNTQYPVETQLSLRLSGGTRRWSLTPLFDDQELDSRAGGGPVYWEGAVSAPGAHGYLELTGYFQALKM
jgi:predicted secreted hydrolase